MLKQTRKGFLLVCDECRKVLIDPLNRPLYFKNKNAFHLHYAYIESQGWRYDSYCKTCNYWLNRIKEEKAKAVENNRNWYITLRELKNAVKFAEEYGNGDCKVIGIGHYKGNLGDSPYVFDRNKINYKKGNIDIDSIYRISLYDGDDDCW